MLYEPLHHSTGLFAAHARVNPSIWTPADPVKLLLCQVYTIYSILSLVFIILIIVTAFITIALTYFQLAVEDHGWWWRSFLCGGSTGASCISLP